jgi:hypothetical protein
MVYDNGEKSNFITVTQVKEIDGRKYILDKLWAMDDNNQALEKYNIYGPIDLAKNIENIKE